ncbi:MAG: protein translocase subunit SecD [Hyphomicrobiaceae bacterium]|nr:protein translocase subunit SecD [Hyphomicrobiaceae bacterium]
MLYFPRWKIVLIFGVCLIATFFAMPNFFHTKTLKSWPAWLPKKQLSLGLDLQGGAHLLYSMNTNELKTNMLRNLRGDVRQRLTDAKIGQITGRISNGVKVLLSNPDDMPNSLERLRQMSQPISNSIIHVGIEKTLRVTKINDRVIHISYSDAYLKHLVTESISGAIETIRRRVDAFGTSEPNIVRQGEDRILVQVPGIENTTSLRELIGKTAKLTFHSVHPTQTISSTSQQIQGEYKSYPLAENLNEVETFYLLKEVPVVRGDQLKDARQGYDQQTNEPIITFTFNQEGARAFAKFTSRNVNRPFAILLDGKILSAPIIREPIMGGSGQISGSFTPKAANELAIQLRSGSLPADLTVIEERTVGPSLGADSISSGLLAGSVGLTAMIFITVWVYGTFGVFAVVGLIFNGMLIIAIMSTIGFALTLPGIAGLILTMGMAVDANVLIYERIREELASGKLAILAVDTGFSRAISTIVDSQLTTLSAAIIMFWLGSGPIRGFAMALSIGIFTSIFTAVTVVRLIIALWVQAERRKNRNIALPI